MAVTGKGRGLKSSWSIWQGSALKLGTGRKTVFAADRDTADRDMWQDWFLSAAGTVNHYTLTAAKGTFTETGIAATLTTTRKIVAANATFVETGQDASLELGRKVTAAVGTFVETGQNATLIATRRLSAAVGSFTETGIDANLEHGRFITAAVGSYGLTGQEATLTHDTVGFTLTAETGTFAVDGVNVIVAKGFYLAPEAAEYVLTGQDIASLQTRILRAGTGQFTATMQTGTTQYHLQRQRQMFSLDGR